MCKLMLVSKAKRSLGVCVHVREREGERGREDSIFMKLNVVVCQMTVTLTAGSYTGPIWVFERQY